MRKAARQVGVSSSFFPLHSLVLYSLCLHPLLCLSFPLCSKQKALCCPEGPSKEGWEGGRTSSGEGHFTASHSLRLKLGSSLPGDWKKCGMPSFKKIIPNYLSKKTICEIQMYTIYEIFKFLFYLIYSKPLLPLKGERKTVVRKEGKKGRHGQRPAPSPLWGALVVE